MSGQVVTFVVGALTVFGAYALGVLTTRTRMRWESSARAVTALLMLLEHIDEAVGALPGADGNVRREDVEDVVRKARAYVVGGVGAEIAGDTGGGR